MSDPISFFNTYVSPGAIERAVEVLRSGWLNEGAVTREFERDLARRLGLANPVAVNSGTAALHLALLLAGVRPGDEVVLPAQTFVATGLAVLMCGGTPVFSDIDASTGNLLPCAVERSLTPRTRAVMAVHWGGYPCDLQELSELAARHGVELIEDAAHALGATYRGRPIGSISRFTAFSFQAIKHLTTGDGGALCCRDPADAREATVRRWFGIDRAESRRSLLGARGFDITSLGFKYHMNNVAAALGLGNLEDFSERLARRRQIAAVYRERLANVAGLRLLQLSADRQHAFWLFTIRVERRDDFARKMTDAGVPVSVVDLRIDTNSVFGGKRELPNQTRFDEEQIAIPLHEALSDDQVDRVVAAVRGGW